MRNIRGLECDGVTDDTVPTLCGIIKYMNNIQYLKFGTADDISSTSVQLLVDTLKTCNSLQNIFLKPFNSSHDYLQLSAKESCT